MAVPSARRRRRGDTVKFHTQHPRRISDASIVRGVEAEVDRTLPFWRCFTDLQLETHHRPQVLHRSAELLCRLPCKVFKQVDVVWARTQVTMRRVESAVPKEPRAKTKRTSGESRATQSTSSAILACGKDENDGDADDTISRTIDTLHFVHVDAFKKGPGWEHSYHVQSVVLRDAPEVLQCVAGAMVSFSFLIFTSLRFVHACAARRCHFNLLLRELEPLLHPGESILSSQAPLKRLRSQDGQKGCPPEGDASLRSANNVAAATSSTEEQLRQWCPPPTSRVLVLGMGGNSMALALRAVLGPRAVIEVVEVEPSVVSACRTVGTLRDDDANMTVHLKDVDACLPMMSDGAYDFIFMDIFEPVGATMKNLHPWVAAARIKLTPGGLLVLNEHQLPSAEGLAPYSRLFGEGNVQAVNMRGWKESVVVCVAPGNPVTEARSLGIAKQHTNAAFNIYEALLPGWLPHFSWLRSVQTRTHEKIRCRVWAS